MLNKDCVPGNLLELLEALMNIELFRDLYLVGGTGLALQIGHRASIDIDLFGNHDLDEIGIFSLLSSFKNVEKIGGSMSIQMYFVDDIKVDIVKYPYPLLKPLIIEEGIRMASMEDIAAMKIAAITQRGSKKDFLDLYYLLKYFSMKEIMHLYKQKITDGNIWLAARSLTYFEDADNQPTPKLTSNVAWSEVKEHIREQAFKVM